MKKYLVSRQAVLDNIACIRARAGSAAVYAVVKCGGYGLGCLTLAGLCAEGGLTRFAVTETEEAEAVARAPFAKDEVLKLTPTVDGDEARTLLELDVTFTVASLEDARRLAALSDAAGKRPRAHIKLDTGMGRWGFLPHETEQVISLYRDFPQIEWAGVFSHLSSAFDAAMAKEQLRAFLSTVDAIRKAGFEPGVRHIAASAGLFLLQGFELDAVRAGSALLGRVPGGERYGLTKTGICVSQVESVRQMPAGYPIGYGACYRTRGPMTIATVPVGSHNGFGVQMAAGLETRKKGVSRLLHSAKAVTKGTAPFTGLVQDKARPVLGWIGTESVMLDVTGMDCRVGDEVRFELNPLLLHDVPICIE